MTYLNSSTVISVFTMEVQKKNNRKNTEVLNGEKITLHYTAPQ